MGSQHAVGPGRLSEEVRQAAARGWRIVPITAGAKSPPLLKNWPAKASCNLVQVEAWASSFPGCNWGVATGPGSGLYVLDIDGPEGQASVEAWARRGWELPVTRKHRTPHGQHLLFNWPEGFDFTLSAGKLGPGLDERGDRGYILLPPSLHPSGHRYVCEDETVSLADMPEWLIDLHQRPAQEAPVTPEVAAPVGPGKRTPVLFKLAGKLRAEGVPMNGILAALRGLNATFAPPHDEAKLKKIAQGVERYPTDSAPEELRPDLICLATVAPRAVNWLWEPYIPARMLSMISGDPGAGKSYLALAVAADLTLGRLPHGSICAPSNVLYLTAENPTAEVVRPRFDLLGGDAARLFLLKGTLWAEDGEDQRGAITLADVLILDAAISETHARLVIVDPIQSYLGAGVDLHRSNQTRPVLDGLAKLAEKHGCAVLLLRHLSKLSGGKAIHRGLGSIDLSGAVRSEMLAGSLPDDSEARALVHIKSNVGPYGRTRGYRIDSQGRFTWTGESAITAEELLAAPSAPEDRSAREDAMEWLADLLKPGSREQKEVRKLANEAQISYATLRRAKEALRVRSFKATMCGPWLWALPEGTQDVAQGAHTENVSTFENVSALVGAQVKSPSAKVLKPSSLFNEGAQKSSVQGDEHLGEHPRPGATIDPMSKSPTIKPEVRI